MISRKFLGYRKPASTIRIPSTRVKGIDISSFTAAARGRINAEKLAALVAPLFPVVGPYRISGGVEPGHVGIDIAAPVGTPVIAPVSGIISREQQSELGYGRAVWLTDPESGYELTFAHLIDEIVSVGQRVTRGELLGYVGSTGYSTGPHLHFEVGPPGADPFDGGRTERGAIDPWRWLGDYQTISTVTSGLAYSRSSNGGTVSPSASTTALGPTLKAPAPSATGFSVPGGKVKTSGTVSKWDAKQAKREAKGKADDTDLITKALVASGKKFLPYAQRTGYIAIGIMLTLLGFVILAWSYREGIADTGRKAIKVGSGVAGLAAMP